jgi:hypothetical protein
MSQFGIRAKLCAGKISIGSSIQAQRPDDFMRRKWRIYGNSDTTQQFIQGVFMRKFFPLIAALSALLVLCTACDGNFQDNPLGYNFVGQTFDVSQHRTFTIPPSHAQQVAHLRPYGLGLPAENFIQQYGDPLAPSQPPTQIWFKATQDTFPNGSVMIVGFDRSSKDNAPRANEISYVAGDAHPTTDTQAETIAESFLPADSQGPVILRQYDAHANTCLSETYTSATLGTLFPAQDFLDASGKLAKQGTVTLSLFPHYTRYSGSPPHESGHNDGDSPPDQTNAVSSFLLTLGMKPYC